MFESLRGRRTQFYIDVLYGVMFLASFAYLGLVEMTPAAAGFAGGLVIGYFLHVWEKMVTYERILEERVSAEAERQVSTEVDEQVGDIETEVEERVGEEVGDVDERIEERVSEKVDDGVDERIEERVEEIREKVEEEEESQEA